MLKVFLTSGLVSITAGLRMRSKSAANKMASSCVLTYLVFSMSMSNIMNSSFFMLSKMIDLQDIGGPILVTPSATFLEMVKNTELASFSVAFQYS